MCFAFVFGVGISFAWWRHQMETFSSLLAICAGNSPASGEFPAQRPVTRSFDVSFDLCLNKRLRKQAWVWWFETHSLILRHAHTNATYYGISCNDIRNTPTSVVFQHIFDTAMSHCKSRDSLTQTQHCLKPICQSLWFVFVEWNISI